MLSQFVSAMRRKRRVQDRVVRPRSRRSNHFALRKTEEFWLALGSADATVEASCKPAIPPTSSGVDLFGENFQKGRLFNATLSPVSVSQIEKDLRPIIPPVLFHCTQKARQRRKGRGRACSHYRTNQAAWHTAFGRFISKLSSAHCRARRPRSRARKKRCG